MDIQSLIDPVALRVWARYDDLGTAVKALLDKAEEQALVPNVITFGSVNREDGMREVIVWSA